ncbi:hypothetical protein CCP3SC1_450016 [Gammaproteobacteria bacterium]
MLPLIVAAAVTGGLVGRKIYPLVYPILTKFEENQKSKSISSAPTLQLLREAITEEQPIILATEEVPLDNRFGNNVLVSEHEFVRTASISFSMARDHQSTSGITGGLWAVVEGLAQDEIKKTLNIELNSQVTRRVKVVFSTAPGHLVRYRVIWKQEARRGMFAVDVGGKVYSVPYLVVFGLSHAIESIAGESLMDKTGANI